MVGYLQNIFMEHDLYILKIFGIKEKCIILTHIMYFNKQLYYNKQSSLILGCLWAARKIAT